MENKIQLKNSHYEEFIQIINHLENKVEIGDGQQLKSIQSNLRKQSSTRATAKKLGELIEDSNDNLKILLVGDVHTNKSQFINELLNRKLMPTEAKGVSHVNSIIRYGEDERVTAYFFDGQIANFSLNQIELFAVSETFSSQIMREGLDYLDIAVNHELLKNITFFDTPSYRKSVYVKENFLTRSQAALWLVNSQFRGLPSERALISKLDQNNKELLFVVDELTTSSTSVLAADVAFYGKFEKIVFSLSSLSEANLNDDSTLYAEANFEGLLKGLSKTRLSSADFKNIIIQRFFKWVDRFILELISLSNRDPYAEAYLILKDFKEFNKEIVATFNLESEEISVLEKQYTKIQSDFEMIETGHQFIQFINNYIEKDKKMKDFIILYEKYEEKIRLYRRKHKTINSEQTFDLKALNEQEEKLVQSFAEIKLAIYHKIQNQLISIENKILEVKTRSEYRVIRLQRACKRLLAFTPIVEARLSTVELLNSLAHYEESRHLIARMEKVNLNFKELIVYFESNNINSIVSENKTIEKQGIHREILEKIDLIQSHSY